MRHWLKCWMAGAILLGGSSCGEGDVPEEVGPLVIVFDVDFLDVYGPIHIDIEGYGKVRVDQESESSCDTSAAVLDADEVAFDALSDMHFFWTDRLQRERGQRCLTIPLEARTLRTGVGYFTVEDPREHCFPSTIKLWFEGSHKEFTGSILRSGKLLKPEPPFTPEASVSRILQVVREGRAFAFGGGAEPWLPYSFEMKDPCGGEGSGQGMTPPEGAIEGFGSSAGL